MQLSTLCLIAWGCFVWGLYAQGYQRVRVTYSKLGTIGPASESEEMLTKLTIGPATSKAVIFGAQFTPEPASTKILLPRHGDSFILILYFSKLQFGLDLIRTL